MRRIVALAALLTAAACSGASGSTDSGRVPEATLPVVASSAAPLPLAPEVPPVATASATPIAPIAPAAPPPPPPIPPNTVVIHIGDSFALAGFAKALKPRMKALGVRYEVRAETSSFTTTWSGKIDLVVANTQPDLVIINLGANEVANIDPAAHAPAIRHIVAALKGRPCVWVSPPSWRKDTGIQDVIRKNSGPCRYFDSDKLVTTPIPRQKDHIHPTDEGGAIWADAFWAWLQAERAAAREPDGTKPANPWLLKPSAPDEHEARSP